MYIFHAILDFSSHNPLGKQLKMMRPPQNKYETFTVIGVVEDFHYVSLRERIQPLALFYRQEHRAHFLPD